MRVCAILNPRAGLRAQRARHALDAAPPTWGRVEVRQTEYAGHARELGRAAAADGADLVLAVGGDGTVNEVAQSLIGTRTPLGLVPMGSGNGLARTIGMALRPDQAIAQLRDAVVRSMDVGLSNGVPFLNVAGAGFDAAVGTAFHEHGLRGGRRGILPYVSLALRQALSHQAGSFRLHAGDALRFDGAALIVAFVNGRQYGAGAVIAPRAKLDDGLLDVVVFEDARLLEILLAAPRLFTGSIQRYRRYRGFTAASVVLTSPRVFAHHRDGEPEPPIDRLEVTLRPKALQILVPAEVAHDPDGPFTPV